MEQQPHQAVEHRLVEDIDQQGVLPRLDQEGAVLSIEGLGEAALLDPDAGIAARQKEQQPGDQREVVGGEKAGRGQAQGLIRCSLEKIYRL